jgi:hypothetical protein
MKYAIPVAKALVIIVGPENIQQIEENLAEYQIERNESNYPVNSVCSIMINRWIKEADYDLCFIRQGIEKIKSDMAKALGIDQL